MEKLHFEAYNGGDDGNYGGTLYVKSGQVQRMASQVECRANERSNLIYKALQETIQHLNSLGVKTINYDALVREIEGSK